jgi:hypothetical protein
VVHTENNIFGKNAKSEKTFRLYLSHRGGDYLSEIELIFYMIIFLEVGKTQDLQVKFGKFLEML